MKNIIVGFVYSIQCICKLTCKHENQYFKNEIKVCFIFAELEQYDIKRLGIIFTDDFTIMVISAMKR